jgi:hypothetical protein
MRLSVVSVKKLGLIGLNMGVQRTSISIGFQMRHQSTFERMGKKIGQVWVEYLLAQFTYRYRKSTRVKEHRPVSQSLSAQNLMHLVNRRKKQGNKTKWFNKGRRMRMLYVMKLVIIKRLRLIENKLIRLVTCSDSEVWDHQGQLFSAVMTESVSRMHNHRKLSRPA